MNGIAQAPVFMMSMTTAQGLLLAQADIASSASKALGLPANWLDSQPVQVALNLVSAIAILIVGWIIAIIAATITKSVLSKTKLDNNLAAWFQGQIAEPGRQSAAPQLSVEKWAATFVFWIVMLFVLVAFLNALKLEVVSQPLNSFLEKIFAYLPQIGAAIAWLAGGWLIAVAAKLLLTRGLQAFRLDDRLNDAIGATAEDSPFVVNETLGNALYWFILLFALYFALGTLGLQQQLQPLENLLSQIVAAVPRIFTALIIAGVGWLAARISRGFISNLLSATGIDQAGARAGLSPELGRQSLSWIIGTLAYTLILIVIGVAALEELNIKGISDPAKSMLQQTFDTLPQIFAAILTLVVAFVVGRYLADLVTSLLAGVGFNNVFTWLGLPTPTITQTPADAPVDGQPVSGVPVRTPSEIVGTIVLIGILLFAVLFAINILQFQQLIVLVAGLIAILGRVLVGVLVFGVGLYLANLVYGLIASSGGGQARILAQTARIVIIVLVVAMALQQIGIATNIVNLAFGLILGSLSVAVAIAFGLGGRDVAAEQLRNWIEAFKRQR
jgi:hypothetical protein